MAIVHRSAQADEDLIDIWLHIAADSVDAADRLIDGLEARWRQLEEYPRSGARREDVVPGLRQILFGQYLILYKLDHDSNVLILRVMHGHRDIHSEIVD